MADCATRGRWTDWADLHRAARAETPLLDRIERVCRACIHDPYAQRHHFWMHYVQARRRQDTA